MDSTERRKPAGNFKKSAQQCAAKLAYVPFQSGKQRQQRIRQDAEKNDEAAYGEKRRGALRNRR